MPFTPTTIAALIVAISFAAGLNVYATIATLGILSRAHYVQLPQGLDTLSNTWVIAVSSALFAIEIFADKIPAFDLVWNAAHTFIRIPVAALLAYKAASQLTPETQLVATLAAAAITAIAHTSKTAARTLVTASPEPLSNIALSSAEDVSAIGLTWIATHHPYTAAAITGVCIVAFILSLRWIIRQLKRIMTRLTQPRPRLRLPKQNLHLTRQYPNMPRRRTLLASPQRTLETTRGIPMYHHVKKMMYTVKVDTPNVRFGNMLLEQFGGANGELAAAMQYTIQGWNCVDDLARRDLLLDIGTEELSHLEVVGALIRLHLKDLKTNREAAEADPLITIAGGGGVSLYNSQGNAWTADYLKITGELDVDLRSNIAAEARAKIVYERLLDHTDDPGTIDTLQFLMTREITHMKAFSAALESMEKPPFSIGFLKPTPGIVDEYFNGSTGDGSEGETDMRGPWQTSFGLHPVDSEMAGGPGLSIEDIDGTEDKEARGKQDAGKKTTTSPFAEALSQTQPSTNKPGASPAAHSQPANEDDDLELAASTKAPSSKHAKPATKSKK